MTKEIRCSSCGKKCLETEKYCRYCHSAVVIYDDEDEQMLDGIEIECWEKFINENASDYIKVFKKNEGKRFFIDFHPSAFMPVFWMLYRKMYLHAIITQIASYLCLFSISIFYIIDPPLILLGIPVVIGFNVFVGMISHTLYKNHCKKHIMKSAHDTQRGGTSFATAFVGSVIASFITYFIIRPMVILIPLLV